jgi:hypothetical protein
MKNITEQQFMSIITENALVYIGYDEYGPEGSGDNFRYSDIQWRTNNTRGISLVREKDCVLEFDNGLRIGVKNSFDKVEYAIAKCKNGLKVMILAESIIKMNGGFYDFYDYFRRIDYFYIEN